MNNKRLASNMTANLVAFAINMLVSFILSPYIVNNLGEEAYGFISLINNFISMSQIATIAFNSMGARFITIAIHQKNDEKAQQYFSSLFYANLLVSAVVMIIFSVVAWKVNVIFDVPDLLVIDVRWSFLLSAFGFALSLIFSVYSVSTYAANRLDLSAWRDMVKQLIRAGTIFLLFLLFDASIVFVAIASIVMELYYLIANRRLTRKLFPTYRVKRKYFSFGALKELVLSGIWNSVGRLSYVLLSDLDLLVANIFISASAMGVLSISKTVPAAINSLITTIVAIFLPTFTICFAKNDTNGLIKEMKRAIKIISIFIAPILCFLVAFGKDFYTLWQPTQDAAQLQLLSILAVLPIYFTLGMKSVNNIFSVTNKLVFSTMATFITSVVTITLEFVLLKYTDLGLLVIAATSSVCMIVKDLTFIPLYAAHCLKVKWYTFYPQVIKEFLLVLISIAFSLGLHRLFTVDSWITLILYGGLTCLLVVVVNSALLLRKNDYIGIWRKVKCLSHRTK